MELKHPACAGRIVFGPTAEESHYCDIDVYGDRSVGITIKIAAKERERNVPLTLRLDRNGAEQLLQQLELALKWDY